MQTFGLSLKEYGAEICMAMIESRNLTSHIYKEEIAEQLARDIPKYYEHVRQFVSRILPNT